MYIKYHDNQPIFQWPLGQKANHCQTVDGLESGTWHNLDVRVIVRWPDFTDWTGTATLRPETVVTVMKYHRYP